MNFEFLAAEICGEFVVPARFEKVLIFGKFTLIFAR